MRAEQRLLHLAVGLVVIIVESGLADADHFGMVGSLEQYRLAKVGVLVGLVRMNADAGPDVWLALGSADHPVPFATARGNIEKSADSGCPRPFENPWLVFGEAFVFEVAVTVDQHHATSLSGISRRGNSPSGLWRR